MFQKGKTSELRMKGALNHLYESPVNILFSFFQFVLLFWSLVWKYEAYVSSTAVI